MAQVTTSGSEGENGPSRPKQRFSTTLIIAAVPILGYAGAFSYEAGWCQYFRLPFEFIRLDLTTGFIVALGVIGGVFWLGSMFIDYFAFERLPPEQFRRMAPPLGFSLLMTLTAGSVLSYMLYVITVIVVFVALGKTYQRVQHESPEQVAMARLHWRNLYVIWTDFADFLGQRVFVYTFVVLNLFAASYNLGYYSATLKSNFLILGDYAVVAIYGDTFIALKTSPIPASKPLRYSLGPDMKLFRVGDTSPLSLKPTTLLVDRPGQKSWVMDLFFKG